jgi:DNA-binding PadR family transcriptional regulator
MAKKSLELLTESMFYVLMAFVRQDCCGTEIQQFVEGKTEGRVRLGPGTLYAILAKFEEEGMICEVAVAGRKRIYRLTEKGYDMYREETKRLRACLQDAESEGWLWEK